MFEQMMMRVVTILAATTLGALQSMGAFAQGVSPCGGFATGVGAFGPFDYRTATASDKRLVEGAHFTPDVEKLRRGNTTIDIAGDIGYTLAVFPNHPRALLAMSNLALRKGVAKPAGARYTIDCYFDRAIRWQPDDPSVRLVLGMHLIRVGQRDAARVQLDIAERNAIDNGNFHYNLGLTFLDVGDADRALAHAWRAQALGFDLPGLRSRLEKMGRWRDAEK